MQPHLKQSLIGINKWARAEGVHCDHDRLDDRREGHGQYAEVNGINLYFESHGAGRPLILLHGGLGSGEMFGPVSSLQVPTLIVAADADMAPPSHHVEIFKLLDGGLRDGGWAGEGRPKGGHALAILPGLTHYNIFSSPLFAAVTLAFLDEQQSQS